MDSKQEILDWLYGLTVHGIKLGLTNITELLRRLGNPQDSFRKIHIAGTDGNLIIDNINNPQKITVNTHDREFVEDIHVPQQITGYEYQFLACRQALIDGLLEPREMPLEETLYVMQLMDGLRLKWGVRYPMDDD